MGGLLNTSTPLTAMDDNILNVADLFSNVHGFLSPDEAQLLYNLARLINNKGNILEIGSFRGRSTIALALGAKLSGSTVWAIDHHPEHAVNETLFGMQDNQYYYRNIAKYEVGSLIKTINLASFEIIQIWKDPISLLWIDGSHTYDDAYRDTFGWMPFLTLGGKIALHDSTGHYPDITRLLNEVLAEGEWIIGEQVDATTVLVRVSK